MQEFQTWYQLLGHLVETPQAKQRLAHRLNVSTITITRWITHISTPRPDMLGAILKAFPEHRETFLFLLAREHINYQDDEKEVSPGYETLPSASFYMRLLSVYRQISPAIRSTTIQQLILTDAIEHLDPQKQGCACALLLCLPPSKDGIIRSLYIAEGKGTHPWPQDLRQARNLLGAESLAGTVTTTGHPLLASREEIHTSILPSRWNQYEKSTFAAPIMRGIQVAGCFLVSSTRPAASLAQQQQRIIYYADLFLLAVEVDQWYDHEHVRLQLMPSEEVQEPFFARLPQQIITRMVHDHSCSYPAMQQRIMQEIETSFIQSMADLLPGNAAHQTYM